MSGYQSSPKAKNYSMGREKNAAQAADLSKQNVSSSTNQENTGTAYDTWAAAVGNMADSNRLNQNTPSGDDLARAAQSQTFENNDGYFELLNQLPEHNGLPKPEQGSTGHVTPQDLSGHNGGYLTHPYTPSQGFVQQDGTHYMSQNTPQPEFIGHHQHHDPEMYSPAHSEEGAPPPYSDRENQVRGAMANAPAPAMDMNRPISNHLAYPLHDPSPPRYREIYGHAPRYPESQAVPHDVSPSMASSAGRFQQSQPDYGAQHGFVAPNVQAQFQHAQHILPRALSPDSDVPYVSDEVFAQAAEVARPLQKSQPRKLAFGNLAQAQTTMAVRKLKQAWKVDHNDATRPQHNQQRVAYVIQLLDALEDISQATDSQGPTTAFSKRWANHPTDPYYNADEMETVCWKMLDIAERLHAHGPAALFIFDPPSLASIGKSRNMSFAERIDAICDLLRRSKSRCDKLMKGEALETLVGAPKQKMMNVETNKVANNNRGRLIGEGRKVVKAAKNDVPAQPSPSRDTDGKTYEPVPRKNEMTPSKAHQPVTGRGKPAKVEDASGGVQERPYVPPYGGQLATPQALDGLYAYLHSPQAGTQPLTQSQSMYGNVLTQGDAGNQSVNNYGQNHAYSHPPPAPYQLHMAQYPPPHHQPGAAQYQRLTSPPRYNTRPPTGQRRSPGASPLHPRKRSIGETGSEGSESPSKRQRTT